MKNSLDTQTTALLEDAGHNLRLLRQAKGWRVEDLALRSGVSEKSIKNIESGKDFLFSSMIALMRVLKEGNPRAVASLVPNVEATDLVEELTYTRLSQNPVSRIRLSKGASIS